MNPNSKTPVMVLQELTVKKNYPSPEYSIIHARQGTHDNEFHYQVNTAGVCAVGIGRSKQIAKHNAASKALALLSEKGIYIPDNTPVHAPHSKLEENSAAKQILIVNSIGSLGEICMEHKLPFPEFIQKSDVGLAHCKEFTYECKIASIVTRATAGTKKHAKQLAAKDMIERIMQILPELVAECSEDPTNLAALTDQDTQAMDNYIQLKEFKRPKPNLAVKIKDYTKNISNIMQEFNVTVQDLNPYFEGDRNEDNLRALLDHLQLDFLFEMLNENPIVVTLTLNTDVPFTVTGEASCIDIAKNNAILRAFEYLEILCN